MPKLHPKALTDKPSFLLLFLMSCHDLTAPASYATQICDFCFRALGVSENETRWEECHASEFWSLPWGLFSQLSPSAQ